jgi:hypothetical protein
MTSWMNELIVSFFASIMMIFNSSLFCLVLGFFWFIFDLENELKTIIDLKIDTLAKLFPFCLNNNKNKYMLTLSQMASDPEIDKD